MAVIPPQPGQLVPFSGGQARQSILPSAFLLVGTRDPIADGLRRRLELSGQVVWVAASTDQINHLAAELHRLRKSGSRHDDTVRESVWGVHQSGAIPSLLKETQVESPPWSGAPGRLIAVIAILVLGSLHPHCSAPACNETYLCRRGRHV